MRYSKPQDPDYKEIYMSSVMEERTIIVTMSPKELRDMADKMERQFPKKKIGDSCFIDFLGYGDGFKVALYGDQEALRKERETGE